MKQTQMYVCTLIELINSYIEELVVHGSTCCTNEYWIQVGHSSFEHG